MAVTLFDNLRVQQRAIFQEHISQGAPNHTLNDIKIALRDGLIWWIEKGREQRNDDDAGNGPRPTVMTRQFANGHSGPILHGWHYGVKLKVVGGFSQRGLIKALRCDLRNLECKASLCSRSMVKSLRSARHLIINRN